MKSKMTTKQFLFTVVLFLAFLRRIDVLRTVEMTRLKFIAFLDNDYVEYRDSLSVRSQELQYKFMAETQKVWQKLTDYSKTIQAALTSSTMNLKATLNLQRLQIQNYLGEKYDKLKSLLVLDSDYHVEFQDIFTSKGYPIETHFVTTADGYILQLFRVQARGQKGINVFKKPVFLNHGLFCSSDVWVFNGEVASPAFILANEGYDVWIGNARGNHFGRNHTRLNPDKDNDFWDFSWQHMALYDVPDSIQYIYSHTRQPVTIIGHSQGALTVLGMLANDVENNTKPMLGKIFLLGPLIFMKNVNNDLIKTVKEIDLNWFMEKTGALEFAIPHRLMRTVAVPFCYFLPGLCGEIFRFFSDTDPTLMNLGRVYVLTGRFPGGVSIKNVLHIHQMVREQNYDLRLFDYGEALNKDKYGMEIAPVLNLSSITTHLYIFGGRQDRLTTIEDIRQGIERLPSVTYQEIDAGHMSFLLGTNMSYLYTIMDAMGEAESAQKIIL